MTEIGHLPARTFSLLLLSSLLGGCGSSSEGSAPAPPATSELVAHESELLKITLSPAAESRLGIVTTEAVAASTQATRFANGEIVAAPAAGGVPITANTDLRALAEQQARADADLARARSEAELASQNAARATALVVAEAGSQRAADEAQTALQIAQQNLRAAQRQRGLLGQSPSALSGRNGLWVRAAVYAGDLDRINRAGAATISTLGEPSASVSARPVQAPPSANPAAATIDLYYALPASGGAFRIGQRVSIALPVSGQQAGLVVPASAIIHDIHGGTWVYVRTDNHAYERRRVEISSIEAGRAFLTRGLEQGAEVVSAGAAELFGTEFGTK